MHLSLSLALGSPTGLRGYNPITALGDDLLAWWTADDADSLTLVGSAVSAWRDQTTGKELVQATSAARPEYSATSFGGAPGLTFDGSDDCLRADEIFGFPSGAAAVEIWAVVQQDALPADTGNRVAFCYGAAAGTGRRDIRRIVTTGTNRAQSVIGDGASVAGPANGMVDFSSRHVLRSSIGAASSTMYVDGTTGATVSVVPDTGTERTTIGANTAATAATFWHGLAREFLVTNPLTANQAAALETWALARRMI